MRIQSILPVLVLPVLVLPVLVLFTGGPAVAATLDCRITEVCEDGVCAAPEKSAGELVLSGFDGSAAMLTYRGETIAMTATAAADAPLRRWSGRSAKGENQSFAWKAAGGDFVAVTVFEGATTAKATGHCGVQ